MSVTQHRIQGLAEVARLTGKSLSTVNRNVKKLRDYGAEKDSDGVWHVPVTAIEGIGWKVQPDTSDDISQHASMTGADISHDTSEVNALRAELSEIRSKLIAAEADADKWQLIAAERLQNLDDLRRSQRLLEARETSSEASTHSETEPTTQYQPMSLFARLRGRKAR